MTKVNENPLAGLTVKELEKLLAEKKQMEKQERMAKRAAYEAKRNEFVRSVVARARLLHNEMVQFKNYAVDQLEELRDDANEYADIRSNSKGGFSLRDSETGVMVSLDRNSIPEYDERAALAEALLKEFLEDTVKKRDQQTYRTITALMVRNRAGDFTPARIAALLKIRDNYDDARWQKAMQLFEEGFQNREISYSVSFYTKDNMGKDKPIGLTFASLPVAVNVAGVDEKEEEATA